MESGKVMSCVCQWGMSCLSRFWPSVGDFGIDPQRRNCSAEGIPIWGCSSATPALCRDTALGGGRRGGSAEQAPSVWSEEQTSAPLQGHWQILQISLTRTKAGSFFPVGAAQKSHRLSRWFAAVWVYRICIFFSAPVPNSRSPPWLQCSSQRERANTDSAKHRNLEEQQERSGCFVRNSHL